MEGVEDLLPTTPAQSGMLFETLARPEGGVNLGLVTAVLPADLDVLRYRAAWAKCIARHQSLRSHFLWEGLSAPVHVIREAVEPVWEILDWRQVDDKARAKALETWRRDGLALDTAPVLRLGLAQTPEGYMLIWACHHALIDDWSMDLILGEVEAFYQGRDLPSPMPFRDYADWLAEREEEADADFWAARMEGVEAPTRLAFAPANTQIEEHAPHVSQMLSLTAAETQNLHTLARELRVTLAAVLSAVWSLVVARMSDTGDATLGMAATQRSAELPGSQAAVGNFVVTLPIRVSLTDQTTLRAYIQARAAAALEEQGRAPPMLGDLIDEGATAAEAPFDTILSIKETGHAGYVQEMHLDQQVAYHSSFALAMIMRPEAALSLTALADPNRLDAAARAQILQMTRHALVAAPKALDQPAMDLSMMAAQPGMQGAPLPAKVPLLPGVICQHSGNAPAIIDAEGTLSFAALSQRVEAFAAQLAAHGAGLGDRVGVLLPRGAHAVAGFLAAWRIGAAYVPLDPAQPKDRLRDMAQAADLCCVLTDNTHADSLENTLIADPTFTGTAPRHDTKGTDTAYVMFTSGSTGVPKGVVISHANLAASTAARPLWYDDRPERFMVVSPFGFDSSVAGIYWALSEGTTLIVPSAEEVQDPARLCEIIKTQRVTHTLCLPSLFDLLLGAAPPGALDTLRCTIVAGEACPEALVTRHHSERPGVRLINEYGPTEATVWCVAADLHDTDGEVPIGRAIPGVTLTLRDGQGRPVPDGLPGLLHVSGPGVTAGYFNAPEATAQVITEVDGLRSYATGDLVRRRCDGQFVYLGRQDDQVKIRGHRIELGEVEARLLALPGVSAAAAVAVPQAGRLVLVAYLCGVADTAALRADIRSHLPGAYCPAHVVVVNALPQTATGKIDRKTLSGKGIPADAAPRSVPVGDRETTLAALWQDLLELPDTPDVETDFFALGGDSLLAMRLVGEVAETFARPLRMADMMRAGLTIRAMAGLLEQPAEVQETAVATWPAPANASQQAMYLAARMNPGQPFFHLTLAAELPRLVTQDALQEAAAALAQRHDILRCRFQLQNRVLSLVDDAAETPVSIATVSRDALEDALATATSAPFDLGQGALWRVHAWQTQDQSTVVQLVIHHTLCDGWSLDLLMRDLVSALDGTALRVPDAQNSFAQFLTVPDSPSPETQAFWDNALKDLPDDLALLPMDHPLPARAQPTGHLLRRTLPRDVSQQIKAMAAGERTSVFVLLWAALGHTLHELTGRVDSLVAVSHANRPSKDFAETVGCFTKALPYRLHSTPQDFDATLRRAAETARAIMAHEDIGPEHMTLPQGTGGPGYLSSFAQVALQYNDFDWTRSGIAGAKPLPFEPTNTSVFEISIAWTWQGEQLECAMLARAELFERETLESWLERHFAFLNALSFAQS